MSASARRALRALALLVPATAFPLASAAIAQEPDAEPAKEGSASLDLGVAGVGLSFGGAPRWTGLRANWSDGYLERIDGVNLTLWKPGQDVGGSVNGLAIGVVAPSAAHLRGVSLGLGVLPGRSAWGVTVGALGVVSGGPVNGLTVSGLGVVTEGGGRGVHVGGLGIVSEGPLQGVNLAGLGAVSQDRLDGLTLAGLGAVAEGGMLGVSVAGLGLVSQRDATGVSVAGLGTVAEGDLRGVSLGGLGTVSSGRIQGIALGGLGVVSDRDIQGVAAGLGGVVTGAAVRGLAAGLYKVDASVVEGISVAGWNRTRSRHTGLAIGLFNQSEELHGVQIGLLNHAANNRPPFRWVPLVNLHLN
ncbi:MAG: hypothetical protein R6X22_09865 [Gemmatimonadota bacterium]